MHKILKVVLPAIVVFLGSCNESSSPKTNDVAHKPVFITNDTIPDMRKTVSKKPVATYIAQVNDPKLERTFGVEIYETPFTFQYLLRMHYEAMQNTDTLTVPNFGTWPVVQVKAGDDKRICIIGFLGKDKKFNEYKMLSAKGDKMKLSLLKKYSVANYRNVSVTDHR